MAALGGCSPCPAQRAARARSALSRGTGTPPAALPGPGQAPGHHPNRQRLRCALRVSGEQREGRHNSLPTCKLPATLGISDKSEEVHRGLGICQRSVEQSHYPCLGHTAHHVRSGCTSGCQADKHSPVCSCSIITEVLYSLSSHGQVQQGTVLQASPCPHRSLPWTSPQTHQQSTLGGETQDICKAKGKAMTNFVSVGSLLGIIVI